MKQLLVAITLCAAAVAAAGQLPKYGKVKVQAEKHVNFAAFKTYTWTKTLPSVSKAIDATITAAIERELAALGMTPAPSGSGDVLVTYTSLNRTDVDLDWEPPGESDDDLGRPELVGTLVVSLLDPNDFHQLLRLRIDELISKDPVQLERWINRAATALFAKYPTRRGD
jgi:hypothetical protein